MQRFATVLGDKDINYIYKSISHVPGWMADIIYKIKQRHNRKRRAVLTTKRCNLRLFMAQDAESLMPILGDPNVMQYSMTGPMDLPAIQDTITEWLSIYKKHGFCPYAVIFDSQLIGYAGLDIREVENVERVQITFRFAQKYWGKGLASEVAEAVKTYAFDKLALPEVIAITDSQNQASIRTISRIGMKFSEEITYGGLQLSLYKVKKLAKS